ncbi:peptidoglycan editing factor PgeF [Alicyclobacillus fastidiosus]|uniref:Purine nucleoside phosphorylase n=1 Tax=Alicyclobacillus fastidiosus TaxID=392011 RepID=A0ABY6ZC09_9BACL|nr:peptidoglycan editing factor PgeF [Alicyclobacillus fastidiosus]WAH40425.1 peptidoglycan editing factor PgeF [Alicyclobacillus fastidiosus]GMA61822.1 laccase domain protein [Alicyclobacillus fastidiosus]
MLTNWSQQRNTIGVQPEWTASGVRALFTFRHHPDDATRSLDFAFQEGTSPEVTVANRALVAKQVGVDLESLVFVRQVHGTDVAVVNAAHRGMGALSIDADRIAADAIITDAVGTTLCILTADCVPVLFYDPVHQAIGAAHSGWRGTVGHICDRVIEAMSREFGTRASDLRVSIGPSIRSCCYEVDDVVAEPVKRAFAGGHVLTPRFGKPGKYWFSMQGAIRLDLERMGVLRDAIEDTGLCTSCRVNHLFSHRKEQGRAGRLAALIALA